MTEPAKVDLKSMSITDEQKAKLKQLFPEVFNEDKVDFDKLRRTLGEELDEGDERFGMTWPGKNDCFKVIQTPSIATLKPCKEESVDWDNTENLFIEGDNLEVLKLLQRSYYDKVKMIYIDPPYNTGKEFVYPDKYAESIETYLAYTGQIDAEGVKFSTNTETEGRFHSKWLNMMYPRLYLAKNLLREDGVMFISIDDREVPNLRKLCDEIFGEENFVANVVWQKKYAVSNDDPGIAPMHDHILVYQKSFNFQRNLLPRTEKQLQRYKNLDNDPKGEWSSDNYVSNKSRYERPTLWYPIVHPKTGEEVWPDENAVWRYSREKHEQMVVENRLYWGPDQSYEKPRLKRFLSEIQSGLVPSTWWPFSDVGHNDEGQKETGVLLGKKIFSTPKPIRLIKRVLEVSVGKDDIVLDFFSGSCATAQAVLDFNKEDNNCCKFVMVQLPEPCGENSEAYKAGYKTIADIGKERIRRVIKKIEEEQATQEKDAENKLPGMAEEKVKLDLGFKVFKLDKSNFNIWDGTVEEDGDVSGQIEMFIDHIDPDSSGEDILYEILVKAGFELTTKIEELDIAGKKVYSIADNAFLICLDRKLTKEVITEMAKLQPARVVCLDAGFADNDQLKTNAVQIMKSHDVEDFRTV